MSALSSLSGEKQGRASVAVEIYVRIQVSMCVNLCACSWVCVFILESVESVSRKIADLKVKFNRTILGMKQSTP